MRIYTRGGDKGKTGIHGGERVEKDDIRIEANGTLDELNCQIGIIRSMLSLEHIWQPLLFRLQKELMVVMSQVATPDAIRHKNPNLIPDDLVMFCEAEIDNYCNLLEDNGYFILPGGTLLSAQLQMARVITRRAERRLWTLHRTDPVPELILQFINRMSDLFFVLAKMALQEEGMDEERWHAFNYKRKKCK